MNNLIEALVVMALGIALQAVIYEIEPTEDGFQYTTKEATYEWPRTLVEERTTEDDE